MILVLVLRSNNDGSSNATLLVVVLKLVVLLLGDGGAAETQHGNIYIDLVSHFGVCRSNWLDSNAVRELAVAIKECLRQLGTRKVEWQCHLESVAFSKSHGLGMSKVCFLHSPLEF